MNWYGNHLKKIAMSPKYIKEVSEKSDLPFPDIFPENNLRIVIPLIDSDSLEIKKRLESGETKTGRKYSIDFDNQTATTQSPTQLGLKPMKYRLGKVVQFELGQQWANKLSHILKGDRNQDKSIIVSRSPIDVLRMSDHKGLDYSCHAEKGIYFDSARMEAEAGGAIAYVVKNSDLEEINLEDPEIFEDSDRGVKGISPLSRIRINRYRYDEDKDVAMAITREYPKHERYSEKPVPGFLGSVTYWLRDVQKEFFDEISEKLKSSNYKAIMRNFIRTGGEYADDSDGDIMNNFFGTDDFGGDVSHSGGASRLRIWAEEVAQILGVENPKLEHCSVYADVDSDYADREEYVYINCGATVTFEFEVKTEVPEKMIEEFFLRGTKDQWGRVGDSINYTLAEAMGLSRSDDPYVDVSQNGNNLKISLSHYAEDINNPDDVSGVASNIRNFEREDYLVYRRKIELFLYSLHALAKFYPDEYLEEEAEIWEFKNFEADFSQSGEINFNAKPYIVSMVTIIPATFSSEESIQREIEKLIEQKVDYIENYQKQNMMIEVPENKELDLEMLPKVKIDFENGKTIMYMYFSFSNKEKDQEKNQLIKKTIEFFDARYDAIMNSLSPQINQIVKKHSKQAQIEEKKIGNNWYLKIKESAKNAPVWETIKKVGPDEKNKTKYLDSLNDFSRRDRFIDEYGWSVPSEEAIKKIKQFVQGRKVLEIGSGLGLWAKLLKQYGVHMTPTDSFESHGTEKALTDKHKNFTNVENIKGEEAIEKYSDHSVLFISWPPYDDPISSNVLNSFKGDRVVYVGEGRGGCTGDFKFHDILNNNFTLIEEIEIPQWKTIHDRITLWERKK